MNRLPLSIFDFKHWSGFIGCWYLVLGNNNISDIGIEKIARTINECRMCTERTAILSIKSITLTECQTAIKLLLLYIQIYSSYYDISGLITPYQFISWAKDRDSIVVPEIMMDWYNKKKSSIPNVKINNLSNQVELLKSEIELLKSENNTLKQQKYENSTTDTGRIECLGFCYEVMRMRGEGRSDSEIAKHLYKDGNGLSYAQVGVLLTDNIYQASSSLKAYGQDLVTDKSKKTTP